MRTTQQTSYIDAVIAAARAGGGKHFCLRARAGTGKTFTNMELIDEYVKAFPAHEITYCAFNASAAKEGKEKLEARGHTNWRLVASSTIHSLGNGLVKFVFKSTLNEYKVRDLIDAQNDAVYREHAANIAQLVHLAKLEGFGFFDDVAVGDTGAWYRLAEHYAINGYDDTTQMDDVVAAAQHVYLLSPTRARSTLTT